MIDGDCIATRPYFLEFMPDLYIFRNFRDCLGYLVGSIAASIENDPKFSNWVLLDGSQKFETIVDVTSQTIWVQSEEKELYSWDFTCYDDVQCMQWVQVSDVPNDIHDFGERPMEKSTTSCGAISPRTIKEPQGKLIECARGSYSGPEYGQSVYYALLDNGKIWTLQTSSSIITVTVLPIVYAFGGLIVSVIAFILYAIIQRRKNKLQVNTEGK